LNFRLRRPAAGFLLSLFSLAGCVKELPRLVYQSAVVGDGGLIARDLYRSSWLPPGADNDLIRIGLVPSRDAVEFRALHRLRIRAWEESSSWEVASPAGVTWRVEALGVFRPSVITHYASVEERLFARGAPKPDAAPALWRGRGYKSARWIGPSPMDTKAPNGTAERWILSLTPPASAPGARAVCEGATARFKISCDIVSRVDLPPIGQGRLTAQDSTFSKDFRGVLEIVSSYGPVEVKAVSTEEVRDEASAEAYGPRLFVVPSPDATVSLVQQTSLRDYLEAVVPSEIFSGGPDEALKAQAVVARTYALRFNGRSRSNGSPVSERPFLICASTACQVYRGVATKRAATSNAVADTKDLVLRDSAGNLAETFYHSICGGHTEPRTNVMGSRARSYLEGVSDLLPDQPLLPIKTDEDVAAYLSAPPASYCGTASLTKADRWRWESRIDAAAVAKVLASLSLEPPLLAVEVAKRGPSGRALEVLFRAAGGSKRVNGELKIRKLLGGLRSSLFVIDAERNGDRIESLKIRGGAGGHGVGLCQMGAIGRAERGQNFRQILEAYYPGTLVAPLVLPPPDTAPAPKSW
jgi:SpoIID/LytB domain protein